MKNFISIIIILGFLANSVGPIPSAQADELRLPVPGARVDLSPVFNPPVLKGIKVHPENPFRFEFILDQGDLSNGPGHSLKSDQVRSEVRSEATKLIKYFLASLTIPEKDLWVNLSPYEKNRIVPESFGQTEMGRDLLAEDYMLKQITASLIYPEGETGRRFWKRVYEEAARKFGTTNIPVNTFNKVWIIPEKAVVYENARAGTAYIVDSRLKVMLEQDYLSMQKHMVVHNDAASLGTDIVREIVIPELTKEVNEDRNFAQLRQVYNSLILAAWYKKKIKDSILGQVYADKKKVAGVGYKATRRNGPDDVEFIYQRYIQAFKKGVYNYIKEEQDPLTQETVPRKYFSGGIKWDMSVLTERTSFDPAMLGDGAEKNDVELTVDINELTKQVVPIHTFSGNEEEDHDLLIRYSKFKFGVLDQIREFAKELGDQIEKDHGNEIRKNPDQWIIVSPAERILGELIADRLGIKASKIRWVRSLLNIKNYGATTSRQERLKMNAASFLIIEGDKPVKGQKVIYIDDMLNQGGVLWAVRNFIRDKFGADIAEAYVFLSIKGVEDASLENRINSFLVKEKGMDAVMDMINEDDNVVTAYVVRYLISNGKIQALRNLIRLSPQKRKEVISTLFNAIFQRTKGMVMKADRVQLSEGTQEDRTIGSARFPGAGDLGKLDPDKDGFANAKILINRLYERKLSLEQIKGMLEQYYEEIFGKSRHDYSAVNQGIRTFLQGDNWDEGYKGSFGAHIVSAAITYVDVILSDPSHADRILQGIRDEDNAKDSAQLVETTQADRTLTGHRFEAAVNKLHTGEDLNADELDLFGFKTNQDLFEWVRKIVKEKISRDLKNFNFDVRHTKWGGQSFVYFDDHFPYVVKAIYRNFPEMGEQTTVRSYELASRRSGGIVTPFLTISFPVTIDGKAQVVQGAIALRVKELNDAYIRQRGTRFVDDLLGMMKEYFDRGLFDHDFVNYSGLGVGENGRLELLDFGITEEGRKALETPPGQKAQKNTIYIAIRKLYGLRAKLNSIDPAIGQYFEQQLLIRYGLKLPSPKLYLILQVPSVLSSARAYREALRKIIKPPPYEEHFVYPFLGHGIDEYIVENLRSRMGIAVDSAQLAVKLEGQVLVRNAERRDLFNMDELLDKGLTYYRTSSGVFVFILRQGIQPGSYLLNVFDKRNPREMSIGQLHFLYSSKDRTAKLNISDESGFTKGSPLPQLLDKNGFHSLNWERYWRSQPGDGFWIKERYRNKGIRGVWNIDRVLMAAALTIAKQQGAKYFLIKSFDIRTGYYHDKFGAQHIAGDPLGLEIDLKDLGHNPLFAHIREVQKNGAHQFEVQDGPDQAQLSQQDKNRNTREAIAGLLGHQLGNDIASMTMIESLFSSGRATNAAEQRRRFELILFALRKMMGFLKNFDPDKPGIFFRTTYLMNNNFLATPDTDSYADVYRKVQENDREKILSAEEINELGRTADFRYIYGTFYQPGIEALDKVDRLLIDNQGSDALIDASRYQDILSLIDRLSSGLENVQTRLRGKSDSTQLAGEKMGPEDKIIFRGAQDIDDQARQDTALQTTVLLENKPVGEADIDAVRGDKGKSGDKLYRLSQSADKGGFLYLLMELLENAIWHQPDPGKVMVSAKTYRSPAGNLILQMTIRQKRVSSDQWEILRGNAKLSLSELEDYGARKVSGLAEGGGFGFVSFTEFADLKIPIHLEYERNAKGGMTTTLWVRADAAMRSDQIHSAQLSGPMEARTALKGFLINIFKGLYGEKRASWLDRIDFLFDDSLRVRIDMSKMREGTLMEDVRSHFETILDELTANAINAQKKGKITIDFKDNIILIKNQGKIDREFIKSKLQGMIRSGTVTKNDFENKFPDNGGEIFDWLRENGYFEENEGTEFHPQILSRSMENQGVKDAFKQQFNVDFDEIIYILRDVRSRSLFVARNKEGAIEDLGSGLGMAQTPGYERANEAEIDRLFETPDGFNTIFFAHRGISYSSDKNTFGQNDKYAETNAGMGMLMAYTYSKSLGAELRMMDDGARTGQVVFGIDFSKSRSISVDQAMGSNKGGIDLTPASMDLQTQNAGSGINFRLDPELLRQLQDAAGFVPVIINIRPMGDIRKFLGIASPEIARA